MFAPRHREGLLLRRTALNFGVSGVTRRFEEARAGDVQELHDEPRREAQSGRRRNNRSGLPAHSSGFSGASALAGFARRLRFFMYERFMRS